VIESYKTLQSDIAYLHQSLLTQQARIAAAKESQKVILARYKAGMGTYIEVLDSQSVLLEAKLALLKTHYTLANTINQLHYLTGEHYAKKLD